MTLPFLLHVAAALLASVALGGMLFFSAVFTPMLFRTVPADDAAAVLREILPVYYLVLIGLVLLAALALWNRPESAVLGVVTILFAFTRYALLPRINRARDATLLGSETEAGTCTRLNRLGMLITVAQIVALLVVVLRLLSA